MENDWADEIVEKCRWMQGSIGALEMARQLRKAKADGMREAAEMFRNDWLNDTDRFYDAAEAFEKIKAAASKLSPT